MREHEVPIPGPRPPFGNSYVVSNKAEDDDEPKDEPRDMALKPALSMRFVIDCPSLSVSCTLTLPKWRVRRGPGYG